MLMLLHIGYDARFFTGLLEPFQRFFKRLLFANDDSRHSVTQPPLHTEMALRVPQTAGEIQTAAGLKLSKSNYNGFHSTDASKKTAAAIISLHAAGFRNGLIPEMYRQGVHRRPGAVPFHAAGGR